MSYSRLQSQTHATIRKAGNATTVQVLSPASVDGFSGVRSGEDKTIKAYFVQVAYTNSELDKNPSLVEGIRLLLSPLDSNGDILDDFSTIVKSKGAVVTMPNGRVLSVDRAKVTIPDGVTPILARLDLGG